MEKKITEPNTIKEVLTGIKQKKQDMFNSAWAKYLETSKRIDEKAKELDRRVDAIARSIGASCPTGKDYCYHLAHNWLLNGTDSEKDLKAYRAILRMEKRRHLISRIADCMNKKAFSLVREVM